ncbi:MAG: regulatory protein RecX [Candidatus Methylomirabilales bacterium]
MPTRSPGSKETAKHAALRLLTIRSRSRRELAGRLRARGFATAQVQEVVDEFSRLGFLNDAALARNWARDRAARKGFGRRRINRELREKGIDERLIRDALDEVFRDLAEEALARRVAQRRWVILRHLPPPTARRRLAAYLNRRGFPPSLIRSLVEGMGHGEDEESVQE